MLLPPPPQSSHEAELLTYVRPELGPWRWVWTVAGVLSPVLGGVLGVLAGDDSTPSDVSGEGSFSPSHGLNALAGGFIGVVVACAGVIVVAWMFNLARPVDDRPGRATYAFLGVLASTTLFVFLAVANPFR